MRPWSSTIILGIYLRTSPSQLNVKPPVLDLLIIGEKCGLAVLGWSHRQGQLHLLLVLPDGSRSWIPACWTDLKTAPDQAPAANIDQPALLGTLSQLLHTRAIVDALLHRREASDDEGLQTGEEECKGGATEPARSAATQRQRGSLAHTRRSTKSRSGSDLGAPDRAGRARRAR
jgi:hypothetical protein